MTTVATYNNDLGRVRLAISGLATDADYAVVERSTDGIIWTTVRGGVQLPLTAGAGNLDDYEFTAGVLNTYRVTAVDSAGIVQVGATTAITGNNSSLVTTLPVGTANGDLITIYSTIRNSAGVPVTPAGWTRLVDQGNAVLFGRYMATGVTAPTLTFTGGVVNADTIAMVSTWRNTGITVISQSLLSNTSQQNIPTPTFAVQANGLALMYAWKQDDWTSIAASLGMTGLGSAVSTAGDDAGVALGGSGTGGGGTFSASSFPVTGGVAAISLTMAVQFAKKPFTDQETTTITPVLARPWLKNPARPGQNIEVEIISVSEITRSSRVGIFPVLSRTLPVSVSDLAGSRVFTIEIDCIGAGNKVDMDNRLASGEPLFLQMPDSSYFCPTAYVVCGDVSLREDARASPSMTFTVPMTEVAKPGASVYGQTYAWSDVVANNVDWTAVVVGTSTWSNLIDRISNSVVIVP